MTVLLDKSDPSYKELLEEAFDVLELEGLTKFTFLEDSILFSGLTWAEGNGFDNCFDASDFEVI